MIEQEEWPKTPERHQVLPHISYSSTLLHLAELDTVTEMRSSANYHKDTQSRKAAQRTRHATKPWIPAVKVYEPHVLTPEDRFIFAVTASRHSARAKTAPSQTRAGLLCTSPVVHASYTPIKRR